MGQDTTPEWRKATLSAMIYDQGRRQCTNTGNIYFDAVGSAATLGSIHESTKNWERAREIAEKAGQLAEFERIKEDWDNYDGPDDD